MLIDQFLPQYDFNEVHQININASSERVYQAIKELTPSELSQLIFAMLYLRQLPAMLMGKGPKGGLRQGPFLNQLYAGGFIPLSEESDREVVFGLIGQFWKIDGGLTPDVSSLDEFLAFDDPEFGKVVANLAVVAESGVSRCCTETRIQVRDPKARRKFALYWRLISAGSGWIRVLWLRAIKRKAEKEIN